MILPEDMHNFMKTCSSKDLSPDLLTTEPVPMDGTCLFHSVLFVVDENYRNQKERERENYGVQFRRGFADELIAKYDKWKSQENTNFTNNEVNFFNSILIDTPGSDHYALTESTFREKLKDKTYFMGEDILALLEDKFKVGFQILVKDPNSNKTEFYCRPRKVDEFPSMGLLLHSNGNHFEPIVAKKNAKIVRHVFGNRLKLYKCFEEYRKNYCEDNNRNLTPTPATPAPAPAPATPTRDPPVAIRGSVSSRSSTVEVTPASWVIENKKGFPSWVTSSFQSSLYTPLKRERAPRLQQRVVRDFMQERSPFRGVLVNHALGSGKTCTAIGVAEALIKKRKVFVLLPASLSSNFIKELQESCGHSSYLLRQHWRPSGKEWVTASDGTHWDNLTGSDQAQIRKQVEKHIRKYYHLIHYDGLQAKDAKLFKDEKGNRFDNSVVIIDEAHNFIQPVVNLSLKGKKGVASPRALLYHALITAKNLKIVLLTGTLIINHVLEIAYLVNLLRGERVIYEFALTNGLNTEQREWLRGHPSIYVFEIKNKVLRIELLPSGYVNTDNGNHVKQEEIRLSMETIIREIKSRLNLSIENKKAIPLLPDTEAEFVDTYVDTAKYRVKNVDHFHRSIHGLVSTYLNQDTSLFPSLAVMEEVTLEMSSQQWSKYKQERDKESEQERKSAKRGNAANSESSTYRMKSRAVCNFAFPEKIKRPYPNDAKALESDLDLSDEVGAQDATNAEDTTKTDVKTYQQRIQDAMKSLAKEGYLGENLATYSPKMALIRDRLNVANRELSLVYSQFRTVEGVGLFERALIADGWKPVPLLYENKEYRVNTEDSEWKERKTRFFAVYGSDKEKNRTLIEWFNSPQNKHGAYIRAILITKAGSEGLDLKNVRHVHIMEPYWNPVRIRQVIGRAIRMNSHAALGEGERTVSVYLYKMKLAQENQKQMRSDNGLSVDQLIHEGAMRKDLLFQDFQVRIREASWDCAIHQLQNTKCFSDSMVNLSASQRSEPLYMFDFDKQAHRPYSVPRPEVVRIRGKKYVHNPDTGDLLDYHDYVERNRATVLGRMSRVGDEKMHVRLIKTG